MYWLTFVRISYTNPENATVFSKCNILCHYLGENVSGSGLSIYCRPLPDKPEIRKLYNSKSNRSYTLRQVIVRFKENNSLCFTKIDLFISKYIHLFKDSCRFLTRISTLFLATFSAALIDFL